MSATAATTAEDREQPRPSTGRARGPLNWRATRFVLAIALAAGMATLLPVASVSAASAAPAPAGHHHGPGGPGGGAPLFGRGHRYGHGHRVSVSGVVSLTSPAGFDLTLAQQRHALTSTSTTVTVDVGTQTLYREPGQGSLGLAGVMTGDKVQVTGTPAGTGTVDALQVLVPLAQDAGVVGTTSSGGFALTLPGPWRSLTGTSTTVDITVNGKTVYRAPRQSAPGLSDVLSGDNVVVTGTQEGGGNVTALVVRIPLAVYIGTVGTPGSSSFPITTRKGATVTVNVSSNTKYWDRGVSSPGLGNVMSGNTVSVTGTQAGAGAVDALLVVVGLGFGHHHGI